MGTWNTDKGGVMMDLKKLYDENADFRSYVDRYVKNYNEAKEITVDEAMRHEMVKNYAKYLLSK